jgi:hypothetical protein
VEKEHWAGEKKEGFLASLAMTIMGDDGRGEDKGDGNRRDDNNDNEGGRQQVRSNNRRTTAKSGIGRRVNGKKV